MSNCHYSLPRRLDLDSRELETPEHIALSTLRNAFPMVRVCAVNRSEHHNPRGRDTEAFTRKMTKNRLGSSNSILSQFSCFSGFSSELHKTARRSLVDRLDSRFISRDHAMRKCGVTLAKAQFAAVGLCDRNANRAVPTSTLAAPRMDVLTIPNKSIR